MVCADDICVLARNPSASPPLQNREALPTNFQTRGAAVYRILGIVFGPKNSKNSASAVGRHRNPANGRAAMCGKQQARNGKKVALPVAHLKKSWALSNASPRMKDLCRLGKMDRACDRNSACAATAEPAAHKAVVSSSGPAQN